MYSQKGACRWSLHACSPAKYLKCRSASAFYGRFRPLPLGPTLCKHPGMARTAQRTVPRQVLGVTERECPFCAGTARRTGIK